ncbi:MAG: tetratricopeptide repeat protein [Tepidisphaeraceae bacterium]
MPEAGEPDLRLAIQHHQAGRLAEAERVYRQVLAQQPNHADALHLLGVLAAQGGRLDAAVELIRRAIRLQPEFAEAHFNLGIALKDMGRVDEAIGSFQQAIRLKPDYAEAYGNLGMVLKDNGRLDEAIAVYRQAIRLKPDYAEVHGKLGLALRDSGQLDEAVASYRRAIRLKPDLTEAHCNLGNALKETGQLDEAIGSYRQALRLKPDFAVTHCNLGNALRDRGQLDEGIASFRQAIRLQPDFADAYFGLGNALMSGGQLEEAIAAYRQAIRIKPDHAEAYGNLGNVLKSIGRLDEAIASYRQAVRLKPDLAVAHSNLGIALEDKGQLDEAIASCRQAIRLKPDLAEAHLNLGNALKDIGQLDEAIASYRQAIRLKPDLTEAHHNLLFGLHYHPGYDGTLIHEEARCWNQRHAEPLKKFIEAHANSRDTDRRLRIGYLSPDFREHCQALFTIPLLSNHDREAFEIFCYADVRRPDGVTERIRRHAQVWRSIVGMTDAEVSRIIREDRIDILVDLTMHMAHGRPLVFARKPAPVQTAWLAYPGTTGLSAMDYRLTDPHLDPPGLNDQFYSETTIRLPDTFWCYDPLVKELAVNPLAAQTAGHVTFGCLNNFCKVNQRVVQLWAQVLKTVPRSQFMLLCPEGSHRQRVLDILQREGINPDRIELITYRRRPQYLELYHRIDVGMDTFPYNGHTTSLDSYWMGVPVITLVGKTVVGRAGLSQLTNLGLPELIAQTPEQYVQIATDLAGDLPRLAELRRTLRGRMQASPLMDAPRFARNVEAAYRQMWRNWVANAE